MADAALSRSVDLARDWGLGGNLAYFRELVGPPPVHPQATFAELAALLATWLKQRRLVRSSQVSVEDARIEYRWRGCRFVETAQMLDKEKAKCDPCPLAQVGLDLFARNGWIAHVVRDTWEAEDTCVVVFEAQNSSR